MIRDKELDDKALLKTLLKDPIGRNEQLSTFLSLINSIHKNSFLTIDAKWGSGKTVFVRQIQYLSYASKEQDYPKINNEVVEDFKKNYTTYYYNAWENDHHTDPLQSLLFNLINDFWSKKEKTGDQFNKISKAFIRSASKVVSAGLIDPEEVRKAGSIKDLVKEITTTNERKQAVNDIIDNYLDLKGRKLLLVIDELDRCRPTFAISLLEILKHYYTNDRVVVLLSTNNRQLSHTVKKVYGESFDGLNYLNKFYDLVFNLPHVNHEQYLNYLGHNHSGSFWKDLIPAEIVKYTNMSLRQINRYYSSLKLIKSYLEHEDRLIGNKTPGQLVKYFFIPYAYALRITDQDSYEAFIDGKGGNLIENYVNETSLVKRMIKRDSNPTVTSLSEDARNIYNQMFEFNGEPRINDYDLLQSAESFKSVILLMNASGNIDDMEDNIAS